jgi:amidase
MYHEPMLTTGMHHPARCPSRLTPGSTSRNARRVVTHIGTWLADVRGHERTFMTRFPRNLTPPHALHRARFTEARTSRRRLVTSAAAAGGSLLAGSRLSFLRASAQTPQVPGGSDGTSGGYSARTGDEIIEETSVADLREGLDNQEFSVADIVEASLKRIEAMDAQGPTLNAMIEVNPDAMAIAEQLDDELRAGKSRGSLHGIPVVIKDVFATGDSMLTTTGSISLEDNAVTRDAFIVEQMREAGMVILGKGNLTEWSNFRGNGMPNGWSSRGGLTVNPYVITHTAWGSSTGPAVAVAASYTPLGVGAETDGSIICPASAAGVVGMKPTVGLVSRQGALGISYSQDSPGPMGRSVRDVAYLLEALAGYDPADHAFGRLSDHFPWAGFSEFPVPDPRSRSYVKTLDSAGLNGVRVGVVRSFFGFDAQADVHVEEAILAMQDAGAEVVDGLYMETYPSFFDGIGEGNVITAEFTFLLNEFLASYCPGGPMQTLDDIIAFHWENPDATQFSGAGDGLLIAQSFSPDAIYQSWYLDQLALNHSLTREQGIDLLMDENDLDVLIAPSCGIPTEIYGGFPGSSTQAAAIAGYPSLTIPIGYTNGLPAGLHLFGRAFSERKILRYAYALEQTLNVRQAPQYLDAIPWG